MLMLPDREKETVSSDGQVGDELRPGLRLVVAPSEPHPHRSQEVRLHERSQNGIEHQLSLEKENHVDDKWFAIVHGTPSKKDKCDDQE